MTSKKTLYGSVLVLYFVIAFEVLIMISPFAGFFYAVFNPVLLKFAAHPATRWLSAFFLPHMVLPGDGLLHFIRILGSILFVAGMACFACCAFQVYSAKLRRSGTVLGGLYALIRHPQYVALSIAGLGLAILWPRILTVVLWVVMNVVYYLLAKDEERRMLGSYRESYLPYLETTGMFLPKAVESLIAPSSRETKVLFGIGFTAVILCGTFLLRSYTVDHLTIWKGEGNVTALAILPEDGMKMEHRLPTILAVPELRNRLERDKQYVAYFIPKDYIMQGMIADTGTDWKLFEKHRTLGMIADWVINPFGHLRDGHHAMHGAVDKARHDQAGANPDLTRRMIFLAVEGAKGKTTRDLLAINTLRVPQFMVDVDVHDARILDLKELPHGSGWGSVPTPIF
jgi:protein-S-isoprenylcysteine O-methyltransferase Ste14